MFSEELEDLKRFAKEQNVYPWDESLVDRAFAIAEDAHRNQLRASHKPFISHPIEVARILSRLHCDIETFSASILHDVVEDSSISLQHVERECGSQVAFLVDALTKLSKSQAEGQQRKDESLRKLLVGVARDFRIAYVKLADRLHNVLTLGVVTEQHRQSVINETSLVYVPLARTIGANYLRRELDTQVLKIAHKEIYKQIREYLHQWRIPTIECQARIEDVFDRPFSGSGSVTVTFPSLSEVEVYRGVSPYEKLDTHYIELVPPRLKVNIRTRQVSSCYAVLERILTHWKSVKEGYSNTLHAPHINGFQALCVTVVESQGRLVDFIISTEQMQQINEYGPIVATVNENRQSSTDHYSLECLRRILQLDAHVLDTSEFLSHVIGDVLSEQIEIYTAKGDVYWMPVGSTVVDFAYRLSESLGQRCSYAYSNGVRKEPNEPLAPGSQVQIVTDESV